MYILKKPNIFKKKTLKNKLILNSDKLKSHINIEEESSLWQIFAW